jgi:5-methyltetrahydropteroyltriglutamate--homocysteine methyltransferase
MQVTQLTADGRPPFRADHIGSLLRPAKLREAFKQVAAGQLDGASFRRIQEEAIREVVRLQEGAGLQVVTDGEFRRASYWGRFVSLVEGFVIKEAQFRFHDDHGHETEFTAPHVVSRLKRRGPIGMEEFSFVKPLTGATPKITMPAPSTMHYWRVGNWCDAGVYRDAGEFFADLGRVYQQEIAELAAAGCQYVQLDEVALANLCDPLSREKAKALGADPEALVDLYVQSINEAVKNLPPNMVVGVHMCRGNFKGKYLSEGGYDSVADKLFNGARVNHFLLEYDTPRAGDFAPLRFLPKNRGAVLGMVSSKVPQLEPIDVLRRRAAEAAKFVDPARLAISPQCGFASTVAGNPVTEADEMAKLRRCVEAAQAIWG